VARTSSYTYDPQTGEWTKSTINSSESASSQPSSGGQQAQGGMSNLTSSTSDKDISDGATEKQYNTIEMNTLEGQLTFIVTEQTIKLRAGDTVNIEGIGKYLSGSYYVTEVTRSISTNGYSHSATVIRTDFGDSLKKSSTTEVKDTEPEPNKEEPVASPQQTSTSPQRTYTVKKGDCLWNIAKQFYGSGSSWNKIYDANTGQIVNPNLIYPGQVFVIP